MNIAALVLTVVFIADDPALPMLAMELVERQGERQLLVATATPGAVPTTLQWRDVAGRTILPVGAFPMGPAGTSVRPAVDGVIVTIDDAAAVVAAFNPPPLVVAEPLPNTTTTKKPPPKVKPPKAPASPHPWPPPSLPVLGPAGVRLFLPAVVDGEPMSASLHAPGGQAIPGFAVVLTRVVDAAGTAVIRAEADVEVAVPRFVAAPAACLDDGGSVLLRQSSGRAGVASCDADFEVRPFSGIRSGDVPAKDRPARGLILRRGSRSAPPGPARLPARSPPLQTPPVKVPPLPIAPTAR